MGAERLQRRCSVLDDRGMFRPYRWFAGLLGEIVYYGGGCTDTRFNFRRGAVMSDTAGTLTEEFTVDVDSD